MQKTSRHQEPRHRIRSKSLPTSLPMFTPMVPVVPQSQPVATPEAPAARPKTRNPFLTPKVFRINSAEFNLCARLPGSQIYQLTMTPADTDAKPKPTSTIPAEY